MIRSLALALPLTLLLACGSPTDDTTGGNDPAMMTMPADQAEQQAMIQDLIAAQEEAMLPTPGPDGFLTADEEVEVMAYFDALEVQDEVLNDLMEGLSQLTPDRVTEIETAMQQILTTTPPTVSDPMVNDAIALYHQCTTRVSQAFLDLVRALPEDISAPENQAAVMREMVAFEQTLQTVMPDMVVSNVQMNQIVGTDLLHLMTVADQTSPE